jgi:hypothetical protein
MSPELEAAILAAVEAEDLLRFRQLAEELPGGLPEAQALVRTSARGVIRPGGPIRVAGKTMSGSLGAGPAVVTKPRKPGRSTRHANSEPDWFLAPDWFLVR